MSAEISACKTDVTYEVQQLVAAALVGEVQHEIAEISLGSDRQPGLLENLRHAVQDGIIYRMLDHDYGIVDISALHQALAGQELDFVEEAECAADGDLIEVVHRLIPMSHLDTEHVGIKIDRDIV